MTTDKEAESQVNEDKSLFEERMFSKASASDI